MPDLAAAAQTLRADLEAIKNAIESKLANEVPAVEEGAQEAAKVTANPLVAGALAAAHLSEVPELVQGLADLVGKVDSALGAAKAQGAAEEQARAAAEAAAAVVPPAEPETPAEPAAEPAA